MYVLIRIVEMEQKDLDSMGWRLKNHYNGSQVVDSALVQRNL